MTTETRDRDAALLAAVWSYINQTKKPSIRIVTYSTLESVRQAFAEKKRDDKSGSKRSKKQRSKKAT
jgi:hypothetical protein